MLLTLEIWNYCNSLRRKKAGVFEKIGTWIFEFVWNLELGFWNLSP
jgi:hypothetical protein